MHANQILLVWQIHDFSLGPLQVALLTISGNIGTLGHIINCNSFGYGMLGCTMRDLKDKSLFDFMPTFIAKSVEVLCTCV